MMILMFDSHSDRSGCLTGTTKTMLHHKDCLVQVWSILLHNLFEVIQLYVFYSTLPVVNDELSDTCVLHNLVYCNRFFFCYITQSAI